jgi:hypothetical protein
MHAVRWALSGLRVRGEGCRGRAGVAVSPGGERGWRSRIGLGASVESVAACCGRAVSGAVLVGLRVDVRGGE